MRTRDIPAAERKVLYFDVYLNGERHRFSDEDQAYQFAKRIESNVFRCEEVLHWTPDDDIVSDSMRIRSESYNGTHLVSSSGNYHDIIKIFHDCLQDKSTRRITVWIY